MAPALAVASALAVAPAAAQEAPSVTLASSPTTVTYPGVVSLSGSVAPPAEGEAVAVVDEAGTVLAEALTAADGSYAVELVPERNARIRAVWNGAESAGVAVKVRPLITVRLAGVRLFGRATVAGRLLPPHPGSGVGVTLLRGGQGVAGSEVVVAADGTFRVELTLREPGTYRAVARFDDDDHLAAGARSEARSTLLPALSEGSDGVFVWLLERRLRRLRYRLAGMDGTFDHRTADAVLAFHKVQGMDRTGAVTAATWRALADPRRPHPRGAWAGRHVEVDQTRQVLYLVEDGIVTSVIHASTGKPGTPTRDGTWTVSRKIAGYSPGRLYYPSYFDGLRAIHGWPSVPAYPASHGCVRVPSWTAIWVHDRLPLGTTVLVYH